MNRIILLVLLLSVGAQSQVLNHKKEYTRQDTLRGSNTEFRNWWNVLRYDIELEPNYDKKYIQGKNTMEFEVISNSDSQLFQIDLQQPMKIDKIYLGGKEVKNFTREGNVYFLEFDKKLKKNSKYKLAMSFSGHPTIAVNPPWDGGWIFTKDEKGRPWMTVACQGLGASVWFPNKDYQGDEPDNGASVTLIVDKDLVGVSNGKLRSKSEVRNKTVYKWEVKNPINNYNIAPYVGHYAHIEDSFEGEKGNLEVDYWVLDYNVEKAKKQFPQAKTMLASFEYWFGPYPFYEDGYKLVEAPHLGMEHQSGIAYGNFFRNGYLETDLSNSGWGLKWDFIIIHESGHEWFGNNITTNEVADMWVHEGFTSYSESLYTESLFGKEAGRDYVIGTRRSIQNDIPLIGKYGVNQEGSSDIYYKGSNMIHTFRNWLNDDERFRQILRGMNETFYHKTVTSKEIEDYISMQSGLDLTAFFNQYLRTTQIPTLEYKVDGNSILYRWTNTVEGFEMPLKLANSEIWIYPTSNWKEEVLEENLLKTFQIDRNFFVYIQQIK